MKNHENTRENMTNTRFFLTVFLGVLQPGDWDYELYKSGKATNQLMRWDRDMNGSDGQTRKYM
jgi:hypothetical protein